MTIIFSHVPKCGGTSIKVQIEASQKLNVFMDYDAPPGMKKRMNANCERRNLEYSFLDFSAFDIVYGHFPLERYSGDKFKYISLVRDPIKRALSEFNFIANRRLENKNLVPNVAQLADKIISGELSFAKWLSATYGENNLYSAYLNLRPFSDFALIGLVENYKTFCEKLSFLLDTEISSEIVERKSPEIFKFDLSDDDLNIANRILIDEIEWYKHIKSKQ